MGLSLMNNCFTNVSAPAPNPDPSRWQLLQVVGCDNAYVLRVRYIGCTNFEGVKVMVFRGRFQGTPERLDPHFSELPGSPIARFRPDSEGFALALAFARSL